MYGISRWTSGHAKYFCIFNGREVRAIYMFCKQIAADVNRSGRFLVLDLQINFMGQGYVLRPCESKSEMPFLRWLNSSIVKRVYPNKLCWLYQAWFLPQIPSTVFMYNPHLGRLKIWLVLKCFVYFHLELLSIIPH